MKLSVGDPVIVRLPGTRRGKRGRVLGFRAHEEWSAARMRSYRSHWVEVVFPDGAVGTFPPAVVTSEALPKQTNKSDG